MLVSSTVPAELLPRAPAGLRTLPFWGPVPLSLRPFRDSSEKMQATIAAMGGVAVGALDPASAEVLAFIVSLDSL